MTLVICLFQLGMTTLVVALLMQRYAWPWLKRLAPDDRLCALLVPHLFRHVGSTNLVPSVIGHAQPAWFSWLVAVGDYTCGLLALLALVLIRRRSALVAACLWTFCALAWLDVLIVAVLGVWLHIPQLLGPQWYVVNYYVPFFVVTQAIITWQLFADRLRTADTSQPATIPASARAASGRSRAG